MNMKQTAIITAVILAVGYLAVVFWYGITQIQIDAATLGERVALALTWLLLPGFTLLFGVMRVARARFFDRRIIDGAPPQEDSSVDIDLRYLQNTLEQVVLAALGWTALAIQLPADQLGVIPVLAVSFVFARVCFFIGYHRSGPARAFGFATTFYPTIVVYVWATALIIIG